MAEVVRYVDPGASGAGDGTSWADAYTSRSAWNTAEATDLVTDGDSHTVYCRSSAGSADSGTVSLAGWTTGASNRLTIEAADGDEAQKDGIDSSRYRIDGCFTNIPAYTTIKGLQFVIADSQMNDHMIDVPSGLSTSDIKIQNCYFSVLSNTEIYDVTALTQESGTVTLENCIVYGPSTIYDGLKIGGGTTNVYHCVITASSDGIERDGGTVTVTDCAVFGCSDDFDGTMTIDHCASDDGDGTNAVSPSGSNWDNEFSDPSTGDFTLLNTGNLYHGGTPISGGPTYDIDGDEWDASTPSIGADEYASGGGTAVSIDDAEHTQSLDAITLVQLHNISTADLSHGHTIDGVSLSGAINVVLSDLSHGHTIGGVTVEQIHILALSDLAHSQTIDSVNVLQSVNITAADIEHAHTVDGVSLVTGTAVAVDDLGHVHSLGSVEISQRHLIEVADLAHSQGIDTISLALASGEVTITFSTSTASAGYDTKIADITFTGKVAGGDIG